MCQHAIIHQKIMQTINHRAIPAERTFFLLAFSAVRMIFVQRSRVCQPVHITRRPFYRSAIKLLIRMPSAIRQGCHSVACVPIFDTFVMANRRATTVRKELSIFAPACISRYSRISASGCRALKLELHRTKKVADRNYRQMRTTNNESNMQ